MLLERSRPMAMATALGKPGRVRQVAVLTRLLK
jgi:hypothetical protein